MGSVDTGARERLDRQLAIARASLDLVGDGDWTPQDAALSMLVVAVGDALAAGVGVSDSPDETGSAPAKERQDARCIGRDCTHLFTDTQLDRVARHVMSNEEALEVCDGIRALLAECGRLREQLDAARQALEELGEPLCDPTFRARLLRQGLSNSEIAQYVGAVEHVQAAARAALGVVGPPPHSAQTPRAGGSEA